MYICPICGKAFKSEEAVAKCMLACWRQANPNHHSKPAPRSEDINTRDVSDDIANFFNGLENRNGRSAC